MYALQRRMVVSVCECPALTYFTYRKKNLQTTYSWYSWWPQGDGRHGEQHWPPRSSCCCLCFFTFLMVALGSSFIVWQFLGKLICRPVADHDEIRSAYQRRAGRLQRTLDVNASTTDFYLNTQSFNPMHPPALLYRSLSPLLSDSLEVV